MIRCSYPAKVSLFWRSLVVLLIASAGSACTATQSAQPRPAAAEPSTSPKPFCRFLVKWPAHDDSAIHALKVALHHQLQPHQQALQLADISVTYSGQNWFAIGLPLSLSTTCEAMVNTVRQSGLYPTVDRDQQQKIH